MASLEFDGLRVTTISEITGTEILGGMPEACKTFYARWEYYNRGDAPLESFSGALEPSLQLLGSIAGGPHPGVGFLGISHPAGWGSIAPRGVEPKRETFTGGVDPGVEFGQDSAFYRLLMVDLPPRTAPTAIPEIGIVVNGPGECENDS